MAMELFLEVYSILEQEDPSAEEIRHALYYTALITQILPLQTAPVRC